MYVTLPLVAYTNLDLSEAHLLSSPEVTTAWKLGLQRKLPSFQDHLRVLGSMLIVGSSV